MECHEDAFYVDWSAPPIKIIETISNYAERITLQHKKGFMVWRFWDGPKNKAPLILLHGGWGSWLHWIKVIPRLAAGRPILVADLPAMGDSSDIEGARDLDAICEMVSTGVKDILPKKDEFDLCGFSFGGIVGAKVAMTCENECRSLTLVGAAGFGNLHVIVEGLKKPYSFSNKGQKFNIHKSNLKKLMIADDLAIDELSIFIHQKNFEKGRFRSRSISQGAALIELLPRLSTKIGGIWGELDATAGGIEGLKQRQEFFRKLQANSKFDIIKGCGHWAMYEKPAEFYDYLRAHLTFYENGGSQTPRSR